MPFLTSKGGPWWSDLRHGDALGWASLETGGRFLQTVSGSGFMGFTHAHRKGSSLKMPCSHPPGPTRSVRASKGNALTGLPRFVPPQGWVKTLPKGGARCCRAGRVGLRVQAGGQVWQGAIYPLGSLAWVQCSGIHLRDLIKHV